MAKRHLSEKEIDQLLVAYRSRRRQLNYELDVVKTAIEDLKAQRSPSGTAEKAKVAVSAEPVVKRGPGRPRKVVSDAPVKNKRGPGRPPKRARQPRELNKWDTAVLDTISNKQLLLPKEELLESLKAWAKKNEPSLSAEEVETYLTRTLQKLSARKKMLGTHHSGLRRGYHYGLREWFFESSGKLRRQHLDKLVLTAE